MSNYLTKDEFRNILLEELPTLIVSIVTPIVHDAIKANNEIIISMFRSEILAIYEEFGKIHNKLETIEKRLDEMDKRFDDIDKRFVAIDQRFDDIDKRFAAIDQRFDDIDKRFDAIDKEIHEIKENLSEFKNDNARQHSKLHSSLNMTLNYKPVIENIDQRLYLMEQEALYKKKKV